MSQLFIMKTWLKPLLLFLIMFPASVFLHEVGHWVIYEFQGIDGCISLQKVNLCDPEAVSDCQFLNALYGGPVVTIFLAVVSYLLLKVYPNSLFWMVMGVVNATFRVLPTVIGAITSIGDGQKGVSDEGNIMLRILDQPMWREIILFTLLAGYIWLIIRLHQAYQPPDGNKKVLLTVVIVVFTVLASFAYPALDKLIFGV